MGARRMWSGMPNASTSGTATPRSSPHRASTSRWMALACSRWGRWGGRTQQGFAWGSAWREWRLNNQRGGGREEVPRPRLERCGAAGVLPPALPPGVGHPRLSRAAVSGLTTIPRTFSGAMKSSLRKMTSLYMRSRANLQGLGDTVGKMMALYMTSLWIVDVCAPGHT